MPSSNWPAVLIQSVTDGPTLTAAASATLLTSDAKFVLPANYIDRIGKQFLIKASGRISSPITTPGTARFDVRFGSTVVFDSLAILLDSVAAHTNVGWVLEILLTSRNYGSAAQFIGQGTWSSEDILGTPATAPKGSLTAILPWNSAPVLGSSFDSTAPQAIDLFFTQTVATGSITVHQYSLWSLN